MYTSHVTAANTTYEARKTWSAGTDQSAWLGAIATLSAGVVAAFTRADTSRLAWRSTTWMSTPPKAPMAPAMPITAAARRLNSTASDFGSAFVSVASRMPRRAKIDGIILYVDPLPMPDSRKTTM